MKTVILSSVSNNNIVVETHLQEAWNNFSMLVQWCNAHTILSIGGVNINFLNLPIAIMVFLFISFAIDQIFFN